MSKNGARPALDASSQPPQRDEECWKKAEEAFPLPEMPTKEAMKAKQEPFRQELLKCFENERTLTAELHKLRTSLAFIVEPPNAKRPTPGARKNNEDKHVHYDPKNDELLQETLKYYREFSEDSGSREGKIQSLTKRANEISDTIKRMSEGLAARSMADNQKKLQKLEREYETGSYPATRGNEIEALRGKLEKEAGYRNGRSNNALEKQAAEAIEACCQSNIVNVKNVQNDYQVSIYFVIDELKKQEKQYRDQLKEFLGGNGDKNGKDGEPMSRQQRADGIYKDIEKKLAEIKALDDKIDDLRAKSNKIFEDFKADIESCKTKRDEIRDKRWAKYRELVQEKRDKDRAEFLKQVEEEKDKKKQKWMEFIQFRESAIQDLIDTLHKVEAGESLETEKDKAAAGSKRANQRRSGPLDYFTRMVKEIQTLIMQLNSMHINHEIKVKGKGCKEADEAFANMLKKDENAKEDVKMVPTKKEEEQERRKGNSRKVNARTTLKTKTYNIDDFLGDEEQAPDAEKKADESEINEKPRFSENQEFILSTYSVKVPSTFDEILDTVSKLEDVIKQRVRKELALKQADLDKIKALKEEFINPPPEKLEEKKEGAETAAAADTKDDAKAEGEVKEGETAEHKTEKKASSSRRRNGQRRSIYWFYVPDELIREAFHFRDEGWPEKLGMNSKPRNQENADNNKGNGNNSRRQNQKPKAKNDKN